MVRKSTWMLIAVLLVLVGLSIYLQRQKNAELAAPTPTSAMISLFSGRTDEPSSIRIENAAGDAVEITRAADGKWMLKAPNQAEADQAAAQAAATQASALRSLSVVKLAPAIVGLDKPTFTLTVKFPGELSSHRLLVGSSTPIQDGYYAQLDDGAYQVVDKIGLDALIGLLKAPPYPATSTPAASPTPAATRTPSSGSPTGSATASTATVSP